MQRWDHPEIPEYDFETDELVYRGHKGNEILRERLERGKEAEDVRQEQGFFPELLSMSPRLGRSAMTISKSQPDRRASRLFALSAVRYPIRRPRKTMTFFGPAVG